MTVVRAPRLRVLADGMPIAGTLAAEIASNNHYAADRYTIRLATSAGSAGLAGWDERGASLIELQAALDPQGSWTSLITGQIDSMDADPLSGTLRIEGRDLSSRLIEARTHEAFVNQTASDVATLLAGRHGLTAQVKATSTPVGRFYSDGHERLTLDRFTRATTEWDLLAWLAQIEGFDLFVSGTTLFFQPPAAPAGQPMVLRTVASDGAAANVTALRVHRALTLAGTVTVTVKSWNSQQQTAFSQSAVRSSTTALSHQYNYARPNLSPDQAQSLAQGKLTALTAHEFEVRATMPGELTMQPRDPVALQGTASTFDRIYTVHEIVRRLDTRAGFVQMVRARAAGDALGAM